MTTIPSTSSAATLSAGPTWISCTALPAFVTTKWIVSPLATPTVDGVNLSESSMLSQTTRGSAAVPTVGWPGCPDGEGGRRLRWPGSPAAMGRLDGTGHSPRRAGLPSQWPTHDPTRAGPGVQRPRPATARGATMRRRLRASQPHRTADRRPGHDAEVEDLPPEAILADAPPPMREIAEWLRGVVARAVPDARERVRAGWRIIGYDVPVTPRRSVYFAWIMVERVHVHLGFPQGVLMADPRGLLDGGGITKKARWTTLTPAESIIEARLGELLRDAVRVAGLSKGERSALAMAREEGPPP